MNKKILLIDDDPDICNIYSKKFRKQGFEITITENILGSYKILEEKLFDMILLALQLSSTDGRVIALNMKQFHKNSLLLFVSHLPLDSQKQKVPYADDYFEKSKGVNQLLKKINELFESQLK